jgi:hypothetical protein
MGIRSCLAAFLFFGASFSVYAADTVTAKVLNTGTYGNGELYIITDTQINEPNCPGNRVEVPASHPQLKIWLATALMAEASGGSIVVHTNGCIGTWPAMSADGNSWLSMPSN